MGGEGFVEGGEVRVRVRVGGSRYLVDDAFFGLAAEFAVVGCGVHKQLAQLLLVKSPAHDSNQSQEKS